MKALDKQLERIVRQLPDPMDFPDLFSGAETTLTALPRNVLQFHRHNNRDMQSDQPTCHHRFVLIFCIHETGGIILDGGVFRLAPGQGILVFPYQSHHYARFQHPERIMWLFTTFEYDHPDDVLALRNTPITFQKRDIEHLLRMSAAYNRYLKSKRMFGTEMPFELAILLSGLLQRQHLYGDQFSDVRYLHFLKPVAAFIHKNTNRTIGVREIADRVHLSPSRLRAKFRQALGISLGTFVRRTKISRACELMYSTDLNMTQVADECGFNSVSSFSRTFRTVFGKPPTTFRSEMRRT